jgi:hypothetical protein
VALTQTAQVPLFRSSACRAIPRQVPSRARWFSLLYSKRWVLYAKRPFGGPKQVLSYLANYTHRVVLSNRPYPRGRCAASDQSVTFTYRDYRHGSQRRDLTLSALEFIRRFILHILPPGLVRIRHCGILGNNRRRHAVPSRLTIRIELSELAENGESLLNAAKLTSNVE